MNSPYTMTLFVPFSLTDQAGVVFFAHELSLFHNAYEHFIQDKLSISWQNWFQNEEWIVPIKHLDVDYLNPLYAGRNCDIEMAITSVSTSSFILNSTIKQDQKLCCKIESVHTFCQKSSGHKIPIPDCIYTQEATLKKLDFFKNIR